MSFDSGCRVKICFNFYQRQSTTDPSLHSQDFLNTCIEPCGVKEICIRWQNNRLHSHTHSSGTSTKSEQSLQHSLIFESTLLLALSQQQFGWSRSFHSTHSHDLVCPGENIEMYPVPFHAAVNCWGETSGFREFFILFDCITLLLRPSSRRVEENRVN